MGIFDNLDTLKNPGGDQLNAAKALIENTPGGITGLISKFKENGLGDIVESWVGEGNNLPISADQLQKVFDQNTINSFAEKIGIDPQKALGILSTILPTIISQFSSGGGAGLGGMIKGVLGNFLGKK